MPGMNKNGGKLIGKCGNHVFWEGYAHIYLNLIDSIGGNKSMLDLIMVQVEVGKIYSLDGNVFRGTEMWI